MIDSPTRRRPAPTPARGPLGRVVATERRPNTPHEFHFWTALDSPVGIGTIVRVDGDAPVNGADPAHLRHRRRGVQLHRPAVAAARRARSRRIAGRTPGSRPRERAEIRLYTAAVLRQIPEEPLQPVPMGQVFLADEEDVAVALRMDGYLRDGQPHRHPDRRVPRRRHRFADLPRRRLPARARGGAPQHHRRLRPRDEDERGRVAARSRSSRTFPESKGSIAAVLLQREGPGPLLPRPARRARLEDGPRAVREDAACAPAPFENVRYFAPYNVEGVHAQHAAVERGAARQRHAAHVGTARGAAVRRGAAQQGRRRREGGCADRLHQRARVDREFSDERLRRHAIHACSRSRDLEAWFRDVLQRDGAEGRARAGGRTTSRRSARCGTGSRTSPRAAPASSPTTARSSDLPFGSFEDRAVYVVDVAYARGGRAGPDLRAHRLASSASTSSGATWA